MRPGNKMINYACSASSILSSSNQMDASSNFRSMRTKKWVQQLDLCVWLLCGNILPVLVCSPCWVLPPIFSSLMWKDSSWPRMPPRAHPLAIFCTSHVVYALSRLLHAKREMKMFCSMFFKFGFDQVKFYTASRCKHYELEIRKWYYLFLSCVYKINQFSS